MLRLAKEVRLVGGDGVDEVLALFLIRRREEVFAILLDGLHAEVANAAQKAALDESQLRLGHFYAELIGNEAGEAREAGGGELHGVDGFSGQAPAPPPGLRARARSWKRSGSH